MFEDIDGQIDDLQIFYWNSGYGGTDEQSSSLDLTDLGRLKSGALLISTQNGSGGDTVDIDLQDSADDSSWSDADTGLPKLNDASGEETYTIDLDSLRRYIRLDLASGDQTVGSSIDLVVAFVACGAEESQTI